MTVSVNSNMNIDRQRARAEAFVNKSDRDVSRIAVRMNSIKHSADNKKFNNRIDNTIKALPLIAVASGLATGRGTKAALKSGAQWGLAIAMPSIVAGANKKLIASEDGKKKGMSFGTQLVASLAGFFGANALLNKAAESKKVNKVADTIIKGVKDTYKKVAKEVKLPKSFSDGAKKLTAKVKLPDFAKKAIDSAKKSDTLKEVADMGLKVGKKAVKYAPDIALGSAIALTLGAAVKQGMQISSTKKHLKEDQLNAAKGLIESYKEENKDLKAQLAEKV